MLLYEKLVTYLICGGDTVENIVRENWVTLKEVQAYLGVSRETVLAWISKRKMPACKVGRLWKFKISEVDEWVRSGGAEERNS